VFALFACTSSVFAIGAADGFASFLDSINACENKQVSDSCTFGSIDGTCEKEQVSVVQLPFIDC
jgi:hypothetical protein